MNERWKINEKGRGGKVNTIRGEDRLRRGR